MKILKKEDILKYLPHRDPFLFLDEIHLDQDLKSFLYLDPSWELFKGHFPEEKIFPGVLQVEFLAQSSFFLFYPQESVSIRLVSVEKSKFKQPCFPEMTLEGRVHLDQQRGSLEKGLFASFSGQIYHHENLMMESYFMAFLKKIG